MKIPKLKKKKRLGDVEPSSFLQPIGQKNKVYELAEINKCSFGKIVRLAIDELLEKYNVD